MRHNHRIVSQALVVATGVRENGEREVLGFALGASEEEAFWLDFLRSLVRRGLKGVQLVTSDAHEGLKKALGKVLAGVSWQRCRVHFMRNLLAHVPRGDKSMVAAAVRTIFAQPDRQAAGVQLAEAVQAMRRRATADQTASTTMKGHVLASAAYSAEAAHAAAKTRIQPGDLLSRAYETTMVDTANVPNRVSGSTGRCASYIGIGGSTAAEGEE